MNDKLPIIRKVMLVAALSTTFLSLSTSFAETREDGGLPSIKGLKLGMPIHEAVAVMNEKAGPIWAATMSKRTAQPFKVMRIPGEGMQQLRLQLLQLVSIASMQLHRVDSAGAQDLFIVVPSTGPDTAHDLMQVGSGILRSILYTGFFAWAGEDERVNLFIIGPTLCNALFATNSISIDEFSSNFAKAYHIPHWSQDQDLDGMRLLIYESSSGQSIALTNDSMERRTLVIWYTQKSMPKAANSQGNFD